MLIFSEYYPDTGVAGIMVIHSSAVWSLLLFTASACTSEHLRDHRG